jgi:peptide/nickel transport system ATP-binding protein
MKQRIVIAMALASEPDLLIADEPTTALDVTIQAQILRLLQDLQAEFDMAILLITHDLGVVAEIADRVVVMYAGKVMEAGDVYRIFEDPAHPYTRALLDCLPGRGGDTRSIGGSLPDPTDPPDGCRFAARCPHAIEDCHVGDQPPMYDVGPGDHAVSCVHFAPGGDPSIVLDDQSVETSAGRADGGRADGSRPDGGRPQTGDTGETRGDDR